ncbi:MAG: hypothetical protein IKC35_03610 [Clostridia bacterium]|nr:hypothetical protein [Clostridia bacterium]
MKTNKKALLVAIVALILSLFTLTGCGEDKAPNAGWEAIQARSNGQFIKCDYIYFKDIGSMEVGWENNRFDGKIYYVAYEDEEGYECTYFIYTIKGKQLLEVDFNTYYEGRALGRGMEEPHVYKGTIRAEE